VICSDFTWRIIIFGEYPTIVYRLYYTILIVLYYRFKFRVAMIAETIISNDEIILSTNCTNCTIQTKHHIMYIITRIIIRIGGGMRIGKGTMKWKSTIGKRQKISRKFFFQKNVARFSFIADT